MAKREEKAETKVQITQVAENKEGGGVITAADFDEIEVVGSEEQVSIEAILSALGGDQALGEMDPEEWQASIVSSDYFWPAARGLAIKGRLLGVEARKTNFQVEGESLVARFYTVELTAPCIAIRSADVVPGQPLPKPVQCSPGQHVSVLERTILRRLEGDIGREVVIVCDGPGRTKRGLNLWKYRSWRKVKLEKMSEKLLDGTPQSPQLPAAQG